MKKFVRLFLSVMKRIFLSKGFWGACIGIAAMNLLGVYQEMDAMSGMKTSVFYLYEIANYVNFWVLYLLFAAIPSASLFCSDWENRFFRLSVVRSSKRVYGAANALACCCSSFLSVFIGEWLFVFILRINRPFLTPENFVSFGLDNTVFNIFMSETKILGYFMFGILVKAFCAAFFSVFSLWLSTKITNIFVALTSPVILYFFLENIGVILKLPSHLQISTVAKGHLMVAGSLARTVFYPIALFGGLALVFGIFFVNNAKRRIENG